MQEATTGGWQRNEDVSVDTALSNPTLFACVTLIASDIGKLRPMLVEQDVNGFWSEVDSRGILACVAQAESLPDERRLLPMVGDVQAEPRQHLRA